MSFGGSDHKLMVRAYASKDDRQDKIVGLGWPGEGTNEKPEE